MCKWPLQSTEERSSREKAHSNNQPQKGSTSARALRDTSRAIGGNTYDWQKEPERSARKGDASEQDAKSPHTGVGEVLQGFSQGQFVGNSVSSVPVEAFDNESSFFGSQELALVRKVDYQEESDNA